VKRFRNAQRNVSETVVETDQTRTDTEQIRTDPPISPQEFETRWAQYPAKDGKIAAQRHWKASVKTPQDLQDYDRSFANYLVHLKVSGYPPKNGSTFFNNWRDFVDWKEPILAKPSKDAIPAFARPSVEAIEQQEQEVMREYREIMGQA
jgi:hypothetical protein